MVQVASSCGGTDRVDADGDRNGTLAPKTVRYVSRLNSVEGCRKEISRLAKEAILGERDSLDAHRIANIIYLVAKLIQEHDMEKKLEELEERLARQDSTLEALRRTSSGRAA